MKQNNGTKCQRIGLTGGIGAGKSTVSKRFETLGAHILDADAISRSALSTHGPCYDEVIALFGPEIVRDDASIDRAAVSARIFSNEDLRLALNAIVHPYVLRTMHACCEKILSEEPDAIVIFDIPLLFECGADADMDCVVVVTAEDALRIERICARDASTPEKAMERIQSQLPQPEQAKLADFLITNNGNIQELYAQVDDIFQRLQGENS